MRISLRKEVLMKATLPGFKAMTEQPDHAKRHQRDADFHDPEKLASRN